MSDLLERLSEQANMRGLAGVVEIEAYDEIKRLRADSARLVSEAAETREIAKHEIGVRLHAESRASALAQRVDILEKALAESISLQSHYAFLLNDYDGGQRMSFASTQEWIDRLITTGTLIARAALESGEPDG